MSLQQILLIITGLSTLFVGGYVLYQKPTSAINRSFFIFTAGMSTWTLGFVFLQITELFIFDKLIHTGGLLFVAGIFYFSCVFPAGMRSSTCRPFVFIPLLLAGLLIPFNLLVLGMERLPDGTLLPVNGPLLPLYIATLAGYMISAAILLARTYRKSHGLVRLQCKYFFLGVAVFIFSALIFDGILPSLGYSALNSLGPLASVAFVISSAYAIVRHQLLDIRIIIQRGAIYLVLVGLIVALYLGILFTVASVASQEITLLGGISAGIATLLGIFGVPPLERYFRKITDPLFFKNRYNYSQALHDLSEVLNNNLDTSTLTEKLREKLKQILKVRHAWITPASQPTPNDTAISIPIYLGLDVVASINLAEKLSGDPFTTEDISLLKTLAHQTAVALSKAQLYTQVKEYSQTLEQRVKERTHDLEQVQQEERQILLNIAHGLQTPLTVLKSQLEQLRRHSPTHDHIRLFEHNIDNVARFIYDLLRLARLEHPRGQATETIDMSQLLEEILEYVGVICITAHIELKHMITPNIHVRGDRSRLEEMITNILSNAIKYMGSKTERTITVSLRGDSTIVALTISDTGMGIAPEALPHIFKRFYRAQAGLPEATEGTGLGLAIAHKIAELHHGSIEATSTQDQGTTFTIKLPRVY